MQVDTSIPDVEDSKMDMDDGETPSMMPTQEAVFIAAAQIGLLHYVMTAPEFGVGA